MAKYLIDSDVLIDDFRGKSTFLEQLIVTNTRIHISFVSYSEIIQGADTKRELKDVKKFLKSFYFEYIEQDSIDLSLELLEKFSMSHGLRFADALIASTALSKSLILLTNNVRHFRFIPNLVVKSPNNMIRK